MISTRASCRSTPGTRLSIAALASVLVAVAARAQDAPVTSSQPPHENRLAKEASPYLRQHKDNPVDWYPWGDEAFDRAKKEDKPVFLSIGYAACHWCHVMAHESFCDPKIAAFLNAHFVCIKVDREERPDVDEIYMAAVQAMGQQGGWPLSVWLTPDRKPFYGGTYFPPEDSMGRPGFRRVLERLDDTWRNRRADVTSGADELATHLAQVLAPAYPPGEPKAAMLAAVLPQSEQRFDAEYGGFGEAPAFAPKFPSASELRTLLRLESPRALEIVQKTLRAMRDGGIYDQLGGGFHRYATDRRWRVPHFEKMLYDNALLVPCYLEAFLRTGEQDYATTARETLDYMLRELRDAHGGFYSSQDAQSEGVEGKFFVWQRDEFTALLGDDAEAVAAWFGVTADGNWEHHNVLYRAEGVAADDAVTRARATLFSARSKRVPPPIDDKVLCAWNGLALEALATGYRVLGDEKYRTAARETADFLVREMVHDGRCQRSWHGGKATLAGYLDDHAALANGLLSVFEIDSDARWLATARSLLQTIHAHFRADDGSFYYTADDGESLLARSKSVGEGSTPSGTALATQALLRAGLLLGDDQLYEMGVASLRAANTYLEKAPSAAPSLVLALQFHLGDPREVVVVGEPGDPRTAALLQKAWRTFPSAMVIGNLHTANRAALEALSPVFVDKQPVDGVPAAYVCRRGACDAPITDASRLLAR